MFVKYNTVTNDIGSDVVSDISLHSNPNSEYYIPLLENEVWKDTESSEVITVLEKRELAIIQKEKSELLLRINSGTATNQELKDYYDEQLSIRDDVLNTLLLQV
jgi:hypothetical protein